jgi:DNA adenine methylase
LDKKDIRFALSNITHYNGNKNSLLIKWMKKYRVHKIKSNYINYHNNKQKKINEVLIANY